MPCPKGGFGMDAMLSHMTIRGDQNFFHRPTSRTLRKIEALPRSQRGENARPVCHSPGPSG